MTKLSETLKAGAPAFPGKGGNQFWCGMTLRDYFAAKAMQAIISNEDLWSRADAEAPLQRKTKSKIAAEYAYSIADDMLEARK